MTLTARFKSRSLAARYLTSSLTRSSSSPRVPFNITPFTDPGLLVPDQLGRVGVTQQCRCRASPLYAREGHTASSFLRPGLFSGGGWGFFTGGPVSTLCPLANVWRLGPVHCMRVKGLHTKRCRRRENYQLHSLEIVVPRKFCFVGLACSFTIIHFAC